MPPDQKLLQGTPQLIRRHDKRHGSLRVLRLESTKIVNELRFEGGMKWAGNEAEHGNRQSSNMNCEAERTPLICRLRSSTSQGAGDIRTTGYPVSGPSNSPLQSTQAQSPSINFIGSPQVPHSGGGPLSIMGRTGNSKSSSSGRVIWLRSHAPCGFIFSCSAFSAL